MLRRLREATQGFVNMIPTAWKDQQFYDDLKAAEILIAVNSRPIFCEVPASDEYCRKHNIQTETYVRSFDYFKVYNAVTNLLNRRNMLLKPVYKEIMTGEKAGEEDELYDMEAPDPEPATEAANIHEE